MRNTCSIQPTNSHDREGIRTCKGSASMSARSATTGPSLALPPPPGAMVATTPVCATGHAYGTPIASSSARTSSLVRCSWKASSGRSWMRRRRPRSHAAKPGAPAAPRRSSPRDDGETAAAAAARGEWPCSRTRRRRRRREVARRGRGGGAMAAVSGECRVATCRERRLKRACTCYNQ